jgi:hypothetical protein
VRRLIVLAAVLAAVLALAAACTSRKSGGAADAAAVDANPRKPKHARRPTAPPGIEARAIAVGAQAPAVSLPSTTGGTFTLSEALARGPAVLVFYRGDW